MQRIWIRLCAHQITAYEKNYRPFDQRAERARITAQIEQLAWSTGYQGEPATSLISEVIDTHSLTDVRAVAVAHLPTFNGRGYGVHHLIGVEGRKNGAWTRLYAIDTGDLAFPIAWDQNLPQPSTPPHPSNPPQQEETARHEAAQRIILDFPNAREELDELVHDHASRVGSAVNNNGSYDQIIYLLGAGETEAHIRAVLSGNDASDIEARARELHTHLVHLGIACLVHGEGGPWGVRIPLVDGGNAEAPSLYVWTEGTQTFGGHPDTWIWNGDLGGFIEDSSDLLDTRFQWPEEHWHDGGVESIATMIADVVPILRNGAHATFQNTRMVAALGAVKDATGEDVTNDEIHRAYTAALDLALSIWPDAIRRPS